MAEPVSLAWGHSFVVPPGEPVAVGLANPTAAVRLVVTATTREASPLWTFDATSGAPRPVGVTPGSQGALAVRIDLDAMGHDVEHISVDLVVGPSALDARDPLRTALRIAGRTAALPHVTPSFSRRTSTTLLDLRRRSGWVLMLSGAPGIEEQTAGQAEPSAMTEPVHAGPRSTSRPPLPRPATHRPRRARPLRRGSVALTLVAAIVGLGVAFAQLGRDADPIGTATGTGGRSAAKAATWADYFGPQSVGTVCTRQATNSLFGTSAKPVSQTVTVVSASPGPEGDDVSLQIDSDGEPRQELRYLLRKDGTLGVPGFTGTRGSISVRVDGFLAYGSVRDILSGKPTTGTIDGTVTGGLGSGINAPFVVHFSYLVSPLRSVPVTTSLGTFDDVVGVQTSFTDVRSDLPADKDKALQDAFPLLRGFTTTRNWFARGAGVVQVDSLVGTVAKLVGCTGPGAEAVLDAAHGQVPSVEPASEALCQAFRALKQADTASSGSASKGWNSREVESLALRGLEFWKPIVAASTGTARLDAQELQTQYGRYADAARRATSNDGYLDALLRDPQGAEAIVALERLNAYAKSQCSVEITH